MKDYYAILGVFPDAEQEVIDAVYNALTHKYHTTPCSTQTCPRASHLDDLDEAYRVLSDPQQREAYNHHYQSGVYFYSIDPEQSSASHNFSVQTQKDVSALSQELNKESVSISVFASLVVITVIACVIYVGYILLNNKLSQNNEAWHHRSTHFIDQHNGTVVDTVTQLQWMQCSFGQEWDGSRCHGSANMMQWQDANQIKHHFAGYDNWRLPTRDELTSLIDCTKGRQEGDALHRSFGCNAMSQMPAINQDLFIDMDTKRCSYWSSSTEASSDHYAWIVCFNYGSDLLVNQKNLYSVRLVRDTDKP